MTKSISARFLLAAISFLMVAGPVPVSGEDGPLRADSRRPYVHRIALYDASGKAINPAVESPPPFSLEATCSKCHDHTAVSSGWHFNAINPDVDEGRPGEPWILTDEATGTQIPMSWRQWPGAWNPTRLGMADYEFLLEFGRHLPGGGPGLNPHDLDRYEDEWELSGTLEIDCLACHSTDREYDPAQRVVQIERENFEYVSLAASGLGIVRGSVTDEAETGSTSDDPFAEFDPAFEDGAPSKALLEVVYDMARFDTDDRVVLDLRRAMPAENCYTCHTNRTVDPVAEADWHRVDEDIHLTSGMDCTSCHRNGIDHDIVRGFEGEFADDAAFSTLTCRGCHYGVPDSETRVTGVAMGGRLGSPLPGHEGIPPVHFDTLSCTACHSGPYPEEDLRVIQTSMAHGLGIATFERNADDLPHIMAPVFLPGHDGLIAPHRMVWPSFFATEENGAIMPLLPDAVKETAPALRIREKGEPLTGEVVAKALQQLAADHGESVFYIAGGYAHRLQGETLAEPEEHPAAEPYTWAIAHDVRPAAQSLGARSCQECHSPDSPFYFAEVTAFSPMQGPRLRSVRMVDFQQLDPEAQLAFAETFRFRTAFKALMISALSLLALLFLVYGVRVTGALLSAGGRRKT